MAPLISLDPSLRHLLDPQHHPWDASTSAALALGLFCLATWSAGVMTGNHSQVDKMWSLTPAVYSWIYAFGSSSPRVMLMAGLIGFWSTRLTLNFNRRGGYGWPVWSGEEDYRWEYARNMFDSKNHPWLWELWHLGFIILYQNVLLFLITMPVHVVWYQTQMLGKDTPLGKLDFLAAATIFVFVLTEWYTDDVQYEFQEQKYAMLKAGVKAKTLPLPFRAGFLYTGVFAMTRHMNYLCEQSIWIVLNVFVFTATGQFSFIAGIGSVLLCILFQGSIWLQEKTTGAKWPLYKEYQKQVPMLLPYGSGFHVKDAVE